MQRSLHPMKEEHPVTKATLRAPTQSSNPAIEAATVVVIMPRGIAPGGEVRAVRAVDVNAALAGTLEQVARELRTSGVGGSAFLPAGPEPNFATAMRQVEAEVYGLD